MIESIKPNNPGLEIKFLDLNYVDEMMNKTDKFDTIICMNVIEHLDDDVGAIKNISKMISDNGCAIVLVPRGMWLYGSQDKILGHKRRYSEKMIQSCKYCKLKS